MTDRREFKRGREAGRAWAINCEPMDRANFWKNRRELHEADSESVFDAIFETDDDDPDGDDWEARHAQFWGLESFGDPPHQDFVRGFVTGARKVIAMVERAKKAATAISRESSTPPRKRETRR